MDNNMFQSLLQNYDMSTIEKKLFKSKLYISDCRTLTF